MLFIIYSCITCLLIYYFMKERYIWNILIKDILEDITSLITGCSRHNTLGLFIPYFIFSSNNEGLYQDCNKCIEEDITRQSNIYNIQLLSQLYNIFKMLDTDLFENNNISSRCKTIQYMLEYIIRNYKDIYNADLNCYQNMFSTYLESIPPLSNKNNTISTGIETIPILEEYLKEMTKCDTIFQNIKIELIHDTFLLSFYTDVKKITTDIKTYISNILD